MAVGKRIENIAKEKKISLRKIALNAGISYNTLYAIVKRDSNRIDLETLEKIAGVLDCTPAYLMGWEEDYEFRDVPPGEPDNLEVTKKWFALKQKSRLDEAYNKLNQTGQKEAVKRVEEMTKIEDYTKSDDQSDPGKE